MTIISIATKPLVERLCEKCNTPFKTVQAEINRGFGRFCSMSCSAQRSHGGDVPNFQCSHCDNPIRVKPSKLGKGKTGLHFCDHECMNTHQWRLAASYPERYAKCLACENSVKKNGKYTSKYCSTKCRKDHTYAQYIKSWLDGNEKGGTNGNLANRIRRWMFEKNNSKCQQCGWSEVHPTTGKIPLTVNHKNGIWSDNHPDNLELLCPNCHSLTSNYGSLNRGNGRPKRRIKIIRENNIIEYRA